MASLRLPTFGGLIARRSIFWKLTVVFTAILSCSGAYFLFVSALSFREFSMQTEQRISWNLADIYANRLQPLLAEPAAYSEIERLLYEIKELNPKVEPFLLDKNGKILAHALPHSAVRRQRVDLDTLKQFLETDPVFGASLTSTDPLNQDRQGYFSVAKLETPEGEYYLYILLANEHFLQMVSWLSAFYFTKSIALNLVFAVIAAAVIGIAVFRLLTRRQIQLLAAVESFKAGNLKSRAITNSEDDIGKLSAAFNDMADTVEKSIETIARNDAIRRDLVAAVAHDLRGPITSIQGFIERFVGSSLDQLEPAAAQQIRAIERNTQTLAQLVEQLFELAKLEAKESTPQQTVFSIGALAEDVAWRLQPVLAEAVATIEVSERALACDIWADEAMLERVLMNLCSNAIRYLPAQGTVVIDAEPVGDRIRVSVTDSGCGIPEEALPRLFERFYRVEKDRSKYSGGSGLGLTIVQKIIEAHAGTISVRSTEGVGTTFLFDLPAASSLPFVEVDRGSIAQN